MPEQAWTSIEGKKRNSDLVNG